tara:strand:- start:199 stop:450 length:252 start_codon:yes stop_codon:yes gene_type:complete
MKIALATIVSFLFISASIGCELPKPAKAWLGTNSKFSKNVEAGKCALDYALADLTVKERRVVANIIANTYKYDTQDQVLVPGF